MLTTDRVQLEINEGWHNVDPPAFTIPKGCKIKVIPPRNGAAARFYIIPSGEEEEGLMPPNGVSVYLDTVDNLGLFGSPYWEIYDSEDTYRVAMSDESFQEQLNRAILRVKAFNKCTWLTKRESSDGALRWRAIRQAIRKKYLPCSPIF